MKPRHKRLALVGVGLAGVGAIAALVLNAFESNLVFFYSPTQVASKEAPTQRVFRIGGLVQEGSVKREGVQVSFVITDTAKTVLAKHDENYMPPEAAEALDKAKRGDQAYGQTVQGIKP